MGGTLDTDSQRLYGVAVGIVTNNQDPQGLGRVKLRFPWLPNPEDSFWAMIAVPMAGKERGTYFLPEIDDTVLVAFEHGDQSRPFVLGALWTKSAPPPETNAGGKNDRRLIRSRSGLQIEFDDTDGREKLTITDKDGEYRLILNPGERKLSIESAGDLTVTAGGKVTIEGKEIELKSQSKTTVKAGGQLALEGTSTKVKGQPINLN
jgi:uncharacterized protein involved in type VI secretion and phage assembly